MTTLWPTVEYRAAPFVHFLLLVLARVSMFQLGGWVGRQFGQQDFLPVGDDDIFIDFSHLIFFSENFSWHCRDFDVVSCRFT